MSDTASCFQYFLSTLSWPDLRRMNQHHDLACFISGRQSTEPGADALRLGGPHETRYTQHEQLRISHPWRKRGALLAHVSPQSSGHKAPGGLQVNKNIVAKPRPQLEQQLSRTERFMIRVFSPESYGPAQLQTRHPEPTMKDGSIHLKDTRP